MSPAAFTAVAPGIALEQWLLLGALLFGLGTLVVLWRRSALIVFMGVELMLNAAALSFVACARALHDLGGQVAALLVMAVGAAEAALGLALVLALFRTAGTTAVDGVRTLRL